MEMSRKLRDITKEDWRILGFHYVRDDTAKKWVFTASRRGLEQLCFVLMDFARDPDNSRVGAHVHIGPYEYLTVMTTDSFRIERNRICGTRAELAALSDKIASDLNDGEESTVIRLSDAMLDASEYSIELRIMEYGYDPARADPQLWDDSDSEQD